MKTSKILLTSVVIGFASLTSYAQTTGTTPPPPRPLAGLSGEIKTLIEANRATVKALVEQRRALIQQLNAATTDEEKAAIRAQLRDILQDQQQSQRELAKAIRDTIRTKRDERRNGGTTTGS